MIIPTALYCDGGVIGPNPSAHGGTWAWVAVGIDGESLHEECGVVEPADLGVEAVTNNFTELYAAWRALCSVPMWWAGSLHTDSLITMYRLTHGKGFKNVPQWLRLAVLDRRRDRAYQVQLVGGHPTGKELEGGSLRRNGYAASRHNVRCDELCTRLAREWMVLKGVV